MLGAGSTVAASQLLAMPQSTVSRKYRTFSRANGLSVLGKSGSYRLPPDLPYYKRLTEAFFEYRRLTGEYSYLVCFSDSACGRIGSVADDYTLFPGFVLFSALFLPWMKESGMFDFILSVGEIPSNSDLQSSLAAQFKPLSDIHVDEVAPLLRAFPFQVRELSTS